MCPILEGALLVCFIFCLLERLSKSDGKIRGLCRRGFRQSRAICVLAMSRDGQTSQEISLSEKGIHFYEQPPRMDSGQSGICHWACTSRRAASGQQSESISSARINLKWKSSLKYKPKDVLSVVCNWQKLYLLISRVNRHLSAGLISNCVFSGMNEGAFEI